jgi:hypothetical protein
MPWSGNSGPVLSKLPTSRRSFSLRRGRRPCLCRPRPAGCADRAGRFARPDGPDERICGLAGARPSPQGPRYRAQQAAGSGTRTADKRGRDITVGIMGLGELGMDAAAKLRMLGFSGFGMVRTEKQATASLSYAGEDGLGDFLASADIFVVLLPLTPDTRNILGAIFPADEQARSARRAGPDQCRAWRTCRTRPTSSRRWIRACCRL